MLVTLASAGREWEHLYFIFELKSVVRLPGHFAGLFAGRIYVWELTILLILLPCTSHSHSCERLHRLVPRGNLYLSSVLSVPLTSPRTCEACRVEAASSQPVHARITANHWDRRQDKKERHRHCRPDEFEVRVIYTLPEYPGVYHNWFRSLRLRSREDDNTVWAV